MEDILTRQLGNGAGAANTSLWGDFLRDLTALGKQHIELMELLTCGNPLVAYSSNYALKPHGTGHKDNKK